VILASLLPSSLAFAIFFGSLRQRGPSKAEREAASVRLFDGPRAAKTVTVILCLLVAPLTIAALHLVCERDDSFVQELR
jgi:hypothetical protein